MKILHVVAARPNFMKVAPIMGEMSKYSDIFKQVLVHTGQHYDEEMSKVFFSDLGLPEPDIYLGVGSGTHAKQTAEVMIAFEGVLLEERPDLVLVVGDVNSTLACALVAAKLHVPVAHVEAGLRSFDRRMPEEINRLLTDQIAEILFTTERSASDNLIRENVKEDKIHFVGNVMIDTLLLHKRRALALDVLGVYQLEPTGYGLLTLHRPSNVDDPEILTGILDAIGEIQGRLPIIFPAHPRTKKNIKDFGLYDQVDKYENVQLIEPLGYLKFLNLMANAKLVLTDSGGIQEETTILGVPCLTLRENTERPVTVTEGTNIVVGSKPEEIIRKTYEILDGATWVGSVLELWDGRAAERIVSVLLKHNK